MSLLDLTKYLDGHTVTIPTQSPDKFALLLSDSKARYLQSQFRHTELPLRFLFASGSNSRTLVDLLENRLPALLKDYGLPAVVYVWIGTCDITTRHKSSSIIDIANWDHTSVTTIIEQLYRARDIVLKHQCTVKFIGLPPQSVSLWNKVKAHRLHPKWNKSNDEVIRQITSVNHQIEQLNSSLGRNTLKFQLDLIKSRKGRAAKWNIDKLMPDGIHPCPVLAQKWLRRLELDITQECFTPEFSITADPQEVLSFGLCP